MQLQSFLGDEGAQGPLYEDGEKILRPRASFSTLSVSVSVQPVIVKWSALPFLSLPAREQLSFLLCLLIVLFLSQCLDTVEEARLCPLPPPPSSSSSRVLGDDARPVSKSCPETEMLFFACVLDASLMREGKPSFSISPHEYVRISVHVHVYTCEVSLLHG